MSAPIRVTCTDPETGDSETQEITNDYIVVCAGNHYVDGIQHYPGTGTTVITIKVDGSRS